MTRAKVDDKSAELDDDFEPGNKRIRMGVGSLDDLGKRYKGKKITRNQLNEDEDQSEDLDLHLSPDEGNEDEEGDEDEDEDEDGDKDEEEEEEEDDVEIDEEDLDGSQGDEEEELPESKSKKFKADSQENDLSIMTSNLNSEVEKGTAIKNQLGFWEFLLETRVKFQNVLNVVNQFPQFDLYSQALNSMKPDMKKSTEDVLNESRLA